MKQFFLSKYSLWHNYTEDTKTKHSKSTCSPPSCKKWRPNFGLQFLVELIILDDGFSANWFQKIISSCYTKNNCSSWLPSCLWKKATHSAGLLMRLCKNATDFNLFCNARYVHSTSFFDVVKVMTFWWLFYYVLQILCWFYYVHRYSVHQHGSGILHNKVIFQL